MNNQSIQEYINDKKEIYDLVIVYLENLEDDDDFLQINDIIQKYKYEDDLKEFKEFLQILNFISINHYFSITFFKRIKNIIHFLENNKVSPPKGNYVECLIEAIKCHHNDIAFYIENNLITADELNKNEEIKERILSNILQFHNYSYFPSNFTDDNEFFYLCNYNYTKLVNIFLSNKEKEVKNNIIVNLYCKLLKTNAAYLFYLKEKDVINKIAIPPSIKRIEFSAFAKFSSLKQISIPSSVTCIGDYAFNKCVLLEKISIPFSVTSIKEATFNYCYKLSQISIPPSIISIEKDAFCNCQSLVQVSIPSSVTSIGNYAFSGCISLKQIFIPSSVLSIGNYAFNFCSSLINIFFEKPSSVKFGIGTFSECYSLQQISIPSSVTSIESKLFYCCESLKQILFDNPSSIKSINDSAFNYCISINHVKIPDSVCSIGTASFYYCSSLTDILIPSSVVSIGESAFENCSSLAHVSLPLSVKTIEYYAFGNCNLLDRSDIPSCFNEKIYESHNDYI